MDIVRLAEAFEKAATAPQGWQYVTIEEFVAMVDNVIAATQDASVPDIVEGNPLEEALATLRSGQNINANLRDQAVLQIRASGVPIATISAAKQVLYSQPRSVMPMGTNESQTDRLVPLQ